jgi:hypothetical protein
LGGTEWQGRALTIMYELDCKGSGNGEWWIFLTSGNHDLCLQRHVWTSLEHLTFRHNKITHPYGFIGSPVILQRHVGGKFVPYWRLNFEVYHNRRRIY